MNREEALSCTVEIEERMTNYGLCYQVRLRAPQTRAVIYESGCCLDRDEAEHRVRSYWRELLGRIPPDNTAFV